ncbi:MAG: rhamnulose-1-phosphate aldolase [Bacteroidales bacterium]|nr:rhamnulose-1-phosphate aldolase [Bacteroidales bacterium]
MILKYNGPLQWQLNDIASVAEYMWQKGWAERNAGNITVNVTEFIGDENKNLPSINKIPLYHTIPQLSGQYYYLTGAGSRMRDIARNPMDQGIITRVAQDGKSIDVLADKNLPPTMELPAHMLMHQVFAQEAIQNGIPVSAGRRVVFHAHPTELIALSHVKALQSTRAITEALYEMHAEVKICVPNGLAWVPYEMPGSMELAKASIKDLKNFQIMLWERHGVLGTGNNILEVFDAVDTLNTAARIYLYVNSLRS